MEDVRSRRSSGGDAAVGSTPGDLDRADRKILATLVDDGRLSWRDLADQVGLSVTPTLRRVRRLELEGYITGYGARLSETKLAGAICAYISVTLASQDEETLRVFEDRVAELPEVMSCSLMTGGADYMLRVVVASLDAYQAFLMRGLTKIDGVAHIQSSFALKDIVRRPSALATIWPVQKIGR